MLRMEKDRVAWAGLAIVGGKRGQARLVIAHIGPLEKNFGL